MLALEMFNMATRCARVDESRLSLLELLEADPEDKNAKAKDIKRKCQILGSADP